MVYNNFKPKAYHVKFIGEEEVIMPRPRTKQDLMCVGNEQFRKLFELMDSITEEQQRENFNFKEELLGKEAHWKRDKNIRDVLIHLYEWHQLLLNWVENNQNENPKPFLLEGYNWKTYGDMNIEFWKKHQNTTYEEARELVRETHKKVMQLAETFSNDELFSKGVYKWVGGSTLGSYFVSVTSSHYDWAMKKIKLYIKNL